MSKSSVGSSFAKKQAGELLRQNRKLGRSWRMIAQEDFANQIKAGTLSRFALSSGTWLPKSSEIRDILHLTHPQTVRLRAKVIIEISEDELIAELEKHNSTLESLTSNGVLKFEQVMT